MNVTPIFLQIYTTICSCLFWTDTHFTFFFIDLKWFEEFMYFFATAPFVNNRMVIWTFQHASNNCSNLFQSSVCRYLELSRFNHSCLPNCEVSWDDREGRRKMMNMEKKGLNTKQVVFDLFKEIIHRHRWRETFMDEGCLFLNEHPDILSPKIRK